MSVFGRKRTKRGVLHLDVPEIARTTLFYRQSAGWTYRDGVVDESVRRARSAKTTEELVDAIESVFLEYELNAMHAVIPAAALDRLGVLGSEAA